MRYTALEYIASFWWILVGVPAFGILCLILAPNAVLRIFGVACILWPLTIPGRAFIVSSKSAKPLCQPTTILLDEDEVLFRYREGGMKMKRSSIYRVVPRRGYVAVWTKGRMMIPVPEDAFVDKEARSAFTELP